MSTTPPPWKYLAPNPRSRYKQLFIKGTRIRARDLYGEYMSEEDPPRPTPEEIAADYSLPVEAVLEAIAYCETNPPEIASDFAAEELSMELHGMNHPDYKYNPKKYYRLLTPEERDRIDSL
jgi:uncharacterized protein (DUF433 family)